MNIFDKKLMKLNEKKKSVHDPKKMENITYELNGSLGKPGVPIPIG